jgi:hypothetical protein
VNAGNAIIKRTGFSPGKTAGARQHDQE